MAIKSRRSPPPKTETYLCKLERFEWNYQFGIASEARARGERDPFDLFQSITIHGSVERPSRFQGKAAKIHVVPDRRLNSDRRTEIERATGVGDLESFQSRGKIVTATLFAPEDNLAPIITMLCHERWKWLTISGAATSTRRRLGCSTTASTPNTISRTRTSRARTPA